MTVPGTGQTWLGTPRTKKAEHGGKTSIGCGRLKEFRAHYVCIYIYRYTWYNWEHLGIFQLSPTVARFFGEQLASGIINCWWNVLAINWFNWMKGNRYTFPFLGCTSRMIGFGIWTLSGLFFSIWTLRDLTSIVYTCIYSSKHNRGLSDSVTQNKKSILHNGTTFPYDQHFFFGIPKEVRAIGDASKMEAQRCKRPRKGPKKTLAISRIDGCFRWLEVG